MGAARVQGARAAFRAGAALVEAHAEREHHVLGGTRVVVHENRRETSIPVHNPSNAPFVVQSWIDEGEGRNKTPFVITPPLQRLGPGKENILRIFRANGAFDPNRTAPAGPVKLGAIWQTGGKETPHRRNHSYRRTSGPAGGLR